MQGSTKIDGTDLVAGLRRRPDQHHLRGVAIRTRSTGGSWTTRFEVMAVIVKGGDLANIYYYDGFFSTDAGLTPPLNGGGQNPQISHVEFCFDPKEGPTPTLSVQKDAAGTSKIQHTWADRQAGQGGGCVRCDVRRQRLAHPCGRRGRLVHLEGDGHALAGADVRRDGHDQARQQRIRRRHRRQRLRLAAGCGDRLRQRAEHRCHGARQHHRELRVQRHAWHTGGEQHRHGDLGLGRLRPGNGDDRMGGSDRGRDPRVRRGRRSDRPVPRARRSHERLVDEDVRRAVDVPERHGVAESRVARTRPP